MATNVSQYALLFATAGNATLVEAQNVDLERMGGGQIVHTLAKRFSGISPGSSFCTIAVTNALPQVGPEVDFGDAIDGYIPTEIGIARSDGKTMKSVGFIMKDSLKQGVDQAASYTFDFVGPFGTFE